MKSVAISKLALCAVLCAFAVGFSAAAQGQAAGGQTQGQAASSVFDEKNFTFEQDGGQGAQGESAERPEGSSAWSGVWLVVRMVVALALVVALMYAFVWLLRKAGGGGRRDDDQFMRVVSSITLAPGKSVQIVSLLDEKAYMLGVSDNAVSVIAEVSDKETVNAMNLYADKMSRQKKPRNFDDILAIFMPKSARRQKGSALEGAGDGAAELIKRSRENLDRGE